MIEIVTATNNQKVLEKNLGKSPCILSPGYPKVYYQRGFTNIPVAYNNYHSCKADIVMYIHQDVYIPVEEMFAMMNALTTLVRYEWGVAGVAGVRLNNGIKENIGWIKDRGKEWGSYIENPVEVDTIDELLLITKGDFMFDEMLEHDFYGADICMQSKEKGLKNYVIPGYVHHNSTRPMGGRTESFYKSQEYFKQKWKEYLPVVTTCCLIEK